MKIREINFICCFQIVELECVQCHDDPERAAGGVQRGGELARREPPRCARKRAGERPTAADAADAARPRASAPTRRRHRGDAVSPRRRVQRRAAAAAAAATAFKSLERTASTVQPATLNL